jgi:hypothetical protein
MCIILALNTTLYWRRQYINISEVNLFYFKYINILKLN